MQGDKSIDKAAEDFWSSTRKRQRGAFCRARRNEFRAILILIVVVLVLLTLVQVADAAGSSNRRGVQKCVVTGKTSEQFPGYTHYFVQATCDSVLLIQLEVDQATWDWVEDGDVFFFFPNTGAIKWKPHFRPR